MSILNISAHCPARPNCLAEDIRMYFGLHLYSSIVHVVTEAFHLGIGHVQEWSDLVLLLRHHQISLPDHLATWVDK